MGLARLVTRSIHERLIAMTQKENQMDNELIFIHPLKDPSGFFWDPPLGNCYGSSQEPWGSARAARGHLGNF